MLLAPPPLGHQSARSGLLSACYEQVEVCASAFKSCSNVCLLLPVCVQYHPESSPGPHDADVCFEMYIDMLKMEREAQKVAA